MMLSRGMFAVMGFGVMALAACQGQPAEKVEQRVQASAEAKVYGVDGYAIGSDGVRVLASDGALIGQLRVEAPSVDARNVTITDRDGQIVYLNEVTRPTADGSFFGPVSPGREGAIQADPALKSFFAASSLRFRLRDPSTEGQLRSSDTASCPLGFASACYQISCSVYDYGYFQDCCDGWCGGPLCWYHITQANAYASCDPVQCPGQRDCVQKVQGCYDPGSCTTEAYGFQYCC